MRYFNHPFNKYLRVCYILSCVLDARVIVGNKKRQSPILVTDRDRNQYYEGKKKICVKGIEKERSCSFGQDGLCDGIS